eukprot:CAMPEP_0196730898 /NCGR_PEP_ID=MMETSP1091-20130531/10823_1 /TAXON_ID=302021 /ORGANISM="Rhodomonas sp., Strain CCMP768" /LENGTH=163 /DNA_ID=CAMNT_0042073983 /DNA_START=1 /DNA_END=488 /DNA_ORIENTATION=+
MKSLEEQAAELRARYRAEYRHSFQNQQRDLDSEWRHSQHKLKKLRQEAVPQQDVSEADSHDHYLQEERKRRHLELHDRYQMEEAKRKFKQNVTKVRSNAHEPRKYFLSHSHKERVPEELCPHLGDKRRQIQQGVREVKANILERMDALADRAADTQNELRYLT